MKRYYRQYEELREAAVESYSAHVKSLNETTTWDELPEADKAAWIVGQMVDRETR